MTPEEEMHQYDDEMYAALDAAEDDEIVPTDKFLQLYGYDCLFCDIDEEHNMDDDINDTTTTTTTEEEEEVSTREEDEEEEVCNTIDNTTISRTTEIQSEFNKFTPPTTTTEEVSITIDEFHGTSITTDKASDIANSNSTVRTANTASESKIIENTTTVHTTNNVHTTHTTTDHEFSDSTVCIVRIVRTVRTVRTTNTTNTTLPTTTNNIYYDNIDQEIVRNEDEGTIVFEQDPSAITTVRATNNQPTPMTTANDIISKFSQLFPANTAKD